MPSHIFTRLGYWDRSLSSNHDSTRSAAAYTVSAHLPGHYHEGLHSIGYLMYAMLQTSRDDEAKQLLGRLANIKKTDTENFKVAFTYASAPARYALEHRMWVEASQLEYVRKDFTWAEFPWAQSIHHFARGIGSARSGHPKAARQELKTIKTLLSSLPTATPVYFRTEVEVRAESVESRILFAEGDSNQALTKASEAADLEDSVDKHPVTPGEVLPARELYADMLFEAGQTQKSLEQYQSVLAGSPNRLNALLGVLRATMRLGDNETAEQIRQVIQKQTRSGNGRGIDLESEVSAWGYRDLRSYKRFFEVVAQCLSGFEDRLLGKSGWSSPGVTVSARSLEDSRRVRQHLSKALFRVLGYGAQGGDASGSVARMDIELACGLNTRSCPLCGIEPVS